MGSQAPVAGMNKLDNVPGFLWTEDCISRSGEGDDILGEPAGCLCAGGQCSASTCGCRRVNALGSDVFTAEGRFLPLVHGIDFEDLIYECGPACSCSSATCPLAVTARPSRRGLRLENIPGKGWGVVADTPILRGEFICSYAGEYITTAEAQRRLRGYDAAGGGHALLVIRQWLPSRGAVLRVNLDGTRRGNASRFLNHACNGGNLQLVMVQRTGSALPRVALFAATDIPAGAELTYSYGEPNPGPGRPCLCGTVACKGYMPHDV